ncbi:MAG: GerMN domain-containing protein [Spirochaetaceae bacterium]|nr:GerMN domain-containing protein [Spirochaetaceae bacterium]
MESSKKQNNNALFLACAVILVIVFLVLTIMGFISRYGFTQPMADGEELIIERAMLTEAYLPQADSLPIEGQTQPPAVTVTEVAEMVQPITELPPAAVNNERTREGRLFFVQAVSDGRLALQSTVVPITYSNQQPLSATINILLAGPPAEMANRGFLTMIPEGSQLIWARVEDGTAILNFNENFRFNTFGRDGYEAELRQIVYTATEFATVERVQFLIESERVDFLTEGISIAEPLSRQSFR